MHNSTNKGFLVFIKRWLWKYLQSIYYAIQRAQQQQYGCENDHFNFHIFLLLLFKLFCHRCRAWLTIFSNNIIHRSIYLRIIYLFNIIRIILYLKKEKKNIGHKYIQCPLLYYFADSNSVCCGRTSYNLIQVQVDMQLISILNNI